MIQDKSCQINVMPWVIRLQFDKEQLLLNGITLLEIKIAFKKFWNGKFQDIKNKKTEKTSLPNIGKCCILSNYDNSPIPIIHIRFDFIEYNYDNVINLYNIIIDNLGLKGIDGIKKVEQIDSGKSYIFNNDTGAIESIPNTSILLNGINMIDIRYMRGIDLLKTFTNSVYDIYETLGIEAARNAMMKEMRATLSKGGIPDVNSQHISLLIDVITSNGHLMSIDRHGINKLDTDPLSRASFEEAVDILIKASVFNEEDKMNTVSSRIMTGQAIKGGTGICDIIFDKDLIVKSKPIIKKSSIIYVTSNKLLEYNNSNKNIFIPS